MNRPVMPRTIVSVLTLAALCNLMLIVAIPIAIFAAGDSEGEASHEVVTPRDVHDQANPNEHE